MSRWLVEEEQPFQQSLLLSPVSRSGRSRDEYAVLLRAVRVLDNRRLFFSADVLVHSVVVDGYPDMESRMPVWSQTFRFSGVRDGASLAIDQDHGVLIYHGMPRAFLNVYLLVVRDTQATREFARVLKENFVAAGIGNLVGPAISIFSGLPPGITVAHTRDLVTGAVNSTLDYFINRRDPIIGVYYGSLLGQDDFGVGVHPSDYPATLINADNALEMAYQVRKDGSR